MGPKTRAIYFELKSKIIEKYVDDDYDWNVGHYSYVLCLNRNRKRVYFQLRALQ